MKALPESLLRRYGISPSNGFLPDSSPLQRLPHHYYEPWEVLVENLPQLLSKEQARTQIEDLPVLDTDQLSSQAQWQRAYVVLGFLTHAYIWGGQEPSKRLPPQLTKPFLAVSEHLGLPPTATFSTLSLWNHKRQLAVADPTKPEDLRSLLSFTGTRDEEWFYMISAAIEAKGAPLITTMLHCIEKVDTNDKSAVLSCLQSLTRGIYDIGSLLERMHERCDPQVFYHNVRPLCAGTKGMAAAGLPQGVFYEEGKGQGQWRQYSGGSNAQSSLIQLFDIFLSVDHHELGRRHTANRSSTNPSGYLQDMRKYMPQPHREFLAHIEQLSNIRQYICRDDCPPDLVTAYNDAVAALTNLRNIHIQIVARYIVTPSRNPPAPYIIARKGKNLATACSKDVSDSGRSGTGADADASTSRQLHGTGGTSVMPFLKRTRDETCLAAIST